MNEAERFTSSISTLNTNSFLKSVESFPPTLQELCDLYVQRVLDICEGNCVRAANILGIGRTTLCRYRRNALVCRKVERRATRLRATAPFPKSD